MSSLATLITSIIAKRYLVEAATRIFGDPDTAMPLVKQLVYEQCTKECRAAITPYKHKGLEVWMKV